MLRFFCHRAIFREIGKVVLLIGHVVLYITNAILCKQHQVIPGRMPYNRIDMLKCQVVLIQEILQKLWATRIRSFPGNVSVAQQHKSPYTYKRYFSKKLYLIAIYVFKEQASRSVHNDSIYRNAFDCVNVRGHLSLSIGVVYKSIYWVKSVCFLSVTFDNIYCVCYKPILYFTSSINEDCTVHSLIGNSFELQQ